MIDRGSISEEIYTPPAEAVRLLLERRTDPSVTSKIKECFPEYVPPENLPPGELLLLLQHLGTPNYECHRFLTAADSLNLRPVIAEYREGKFASANVVKRKLLKLDFYCGKKNGEQVIKNKVCPVDPQKLEGVALSEIKLEDGTSLHEFHGKLLETAYGDKKPEVIDFSDWYKRNGGRASEYYKHLFALFIQNGILIEDYLFEDSEERRFFENILLKNFRQVRDLTGFKPLIISMSHSLLEGERFWHLYPETLASSPVIQSLASNKKDVE